MPGPGGGGFGGGGGRGGSFGGGGGFSGGGGRGGSFGGHHHHYHRPFGFWFWPRPYYYGYGGGFFGGFFMILLLPIIVLILASIFFVSSLINSISAISQGGIIQYDEVAFRNYTISQYNEIYEPNSEGYEDNIVIAFLTYEDNYEYNYMAIVGDHLEMQVNYMFGGNNTALGTAMHNAIPQNYSGAIHNIRFAINTMESKVNAIPASNRLICKETQQASKHEVINKTNLSISTESIEAAAASFTESTGIPISIVIDEAEDVFGKTVPASYIITLIICLIIIILAIVFIVRGIRARKYRGGGPGGYSGGRYDNNNGNSAFHNMYGP